MSGVERHVLAPGYDISRVINGGWQLAADHGSSRRSSRQIESDLLRLAEAGFTTFDCADIYIGVEELLARVRRAWRARGGAPEELQIHTKYVPDRSSLGEVNRARVERAIDRSLSRLDVERLDLVQFHWWDFEVPGWIEAAGVLAELRRSGKIRELGVTNFDCSHLAALLDAGVPVRTHQTQYSLLDRRPEGGMVELCNTHGVDLLCYGTLAGGFLSERWIGTPAPALGEGANRSLTKYRLILEEAGGWEPYQALLQELADIARRHEVSLANVAARWVLERPGVAAVIVGAATADHLSENLALFDWQLSAKDLEQLEAALALCGSPPGDTYELERRPGGPHAAILKTELHGAG